MPLAYAHFVQFLVDSFLLIAPFALYSELGIWSIPAVGLLTLFYAGLLDLAKILLDPLDNDEYYDAPVKFDIGVLIRESNSGSTCWKYSAEVPPFATNLKVE
jgi:predicted membrane chloride channel (bestrophin family)